MEKYGPDGKEVVDVPERPDLRCVEHGNLCECLHGMLGRLMILEQRVLMLEERLSEV